MRTLRWLAVAAVIAAFTGMPFVSHARAQVGVAVSVGVAPPPFPVNAYYQPACPGDGYMWTPGYWSWSDGWYWIPGVWVYPPYIGALWTPGYWGFGGGYYGWYPGYWGLSVGYYGGVYYGGGYYGRGFIGGGWRHRIYYNNLSVNRITNITHIHNYSGQRGPGGFSPHQYNTAAYGHGTAARSSQMFRGTGVRGATTGAHTPMNASLSQAEKYASSHGTLAAYRSRTIQAGQAGHTTQAGRGLQTANRNPMGTAARSGLQTANHNTLANNTVRGSTLNHNLNNSANRQQANTGRQLITANRGGSAFAGNRNSMNQTAGRSAMRSANGSMMASNRTPAEFGRMNNGTRPLITANHNFSASSRGYGNSFRSSTSARGYQGYGSPRGNGFANGGFSNRPTQAFGGQRGYVYNGGSRAYSAPRSYGGGSRAYSAPRSYGGGSHSYSAPRSSGGFGGGGFHGGGGGGFHGGGGGGFHGGGGGVRR